MRRSVSLSGVQRTQSLKRPTLCFELALDGVSCLTSSSFEVGELRCTIGDNAPRGVHMSGLNGVFSLSTIPLEENLFVPRAAGLNFELVFDGATWLPERLFEPRRAPMVLENISSHSATLHQPPTPFWGLESWTQFTLVTPHYLDFKFTCVPRKDSFRFGWIGLFWASYINEPSDKSIYFLGSPPPPGYHPPVAHCPQYQLRKNAPVWLQYCTHYHGRDSTVRYIEDHKALEFTKCPGDFRKWLFPSSSPLRYEEPFYYGCFSDHVYMIMFDKPENTRFSHSPSGGGYSANMNDTNPAWDFQFIIPDYELNEQYGFSARVVYRKFVDRRNLLEEYHKWKAGRHS